MQHKVYTQHTQCMNIDTVYTLYECLSVNSTMTGYHVCITYINEFLFQCTSYFGFVVHSCVRFADTFRFIVSRFGKCFDELCGAIWHTT